jgi:AcrR family transcriptional regulator
MRAMSDKRKRRTAGDARDAILDAAEKRLRDSGPDAIRLQEVAAEVGVSHPAVLHHFGSREGLVHAVVDRAIRMLQDDLARALVRRPEGEHPDGAALFERTFDVLFDKGHARLLAWLLLSGRDPFATEAAREGWARIAEITHATRVAATRGRRKPTYDDTRFAVVLSALALFGQAIAGRATFELAGLGRGPAVERRFREWFASLLAEHMKSAGAPRRSGPRPHHDARRPVRTGKRARRDAT